MQLHSVALCCTLDVHLYFLGTMPPLYPVAPHTKKICKNAMMSHKKSLIPRDPQYN